MFCLAFFVSHASLAAADYSSDFTDKRYRFDYYIEGNYTTAKIIPDCIYEEAIWGGSKTNLIDTFEYGELLFKITDANTNRLIFSKGYSNLFDEWQTTEEAKSSSTRYHECILFPAPRREAVLEIFKRDSTLAFVKIFDIKINPFSKSIIRKSPLKTTPKTINKSSESSKALDIVFLSEGYVTGQEEMFFSDVERFKNYMFAWEPYSSFQKSINILAVFAPSTEEGTDIPGENIWANTITDAHFNTFGIDRYLTVPDICKIYDYLTEYPVDQVCVLVNSGKYGGGSIYNFCSVFTADNERAELVFLHEFGHGFASLADEYFNSPVTYVDLGSKSYEPYEPNITNLADFDKKWKFMISDTIPIPTPDVPDYNNIVGLFEGANYKPKGFYRPQRDCAMRSTGIKQFCAVCKISIERMLLFCSE
jgi:hypothetical protein